MTTSSQAAAVARLRELALELAQIAEALADAAAADVDRDPPPPSIDDWYQRRAATVSSSSEIDDLAAAAASGFGASRECIRHLRRQYAPPHWTRPGPRLVEIAPRSRRRLD